MITAGPDDDNDGPATTPPPLYIGISRFVCMWMGIVCRGSGFANYFIRARRVVFVLDELYT